GRMPGRGLRHPPRGSTAATGSPPAAGPRGRSTGVSWCVLEGVVGEFATKAGALTRGGLHGDSALQQPHRLGDDGEANAVAGGAVAAAGAALVEGREDVGQFVRVDAGA